MQLFDFEQISYKRFSNFLTTGNRYKSNNCNIYIPTTFKTTNGHIRYEWGHSVFFIAHQPNKSVQVLGSITIYR